VARLFKIACLNYPKGKIAAICTIGKTGNASQIAEIATRSPYVESPH
jgi:hypothetical protein